jgi:hypothetical protein
MASEYTGTLLLTTVFLEGRREAGEIVHPAANCPALEISQTGGERRQAGVAGRREGGKAGRREGGKAGRQEGRKAGRQEGRKAGRQKAGRLEGKAGGSEG